MSHPYARRMAAISLFVLCAVPLQAQDVPTVVSLNVGLIGAPTLFSAGPGRLFYPEIQLSRRLVSFPNATFALEGSVFWGFWSQGREAGSRSQRCCTVSQRAHLVGARVFVTPTAGRFWIAPYAGLALQFRRYTPVEPIDDLPPRGERYATVEAGLRVRLRLTQRLMAEAKGHGFVPLTSDAVGRQFAFGAGLACAL